MKKASEQIDDLLIDVEAIRMRLLHLRNVCRAEENGDDPPPPYFAVAADLVEHFDAKAREAIEH